MFPSEILILTSIEKAGGFSDKQLSRPIDITGKYVGYLYDSLVSRGFLEGDKATGYRLTRKGSEAIAEALTGQQTGVTCR